MQTPLTEIIRSPSAGTILPKHSVFIIMAIKTSSLVSVLDSRKTSSTQRGSEESLILGEEDEEDEEDEEEEDEEPNNNPVLKNRVVV